MFLLAAKYEYSGKRMKELRKKRYPQIEAFCIDLGRSFRSVELYELGKPPTIKVLLGAAELLEVHPGKFFVKVDE